MCLPVCVFIHVLAYPSWSLLSFLDMWIYSFIKLETFLVTVSLNIPSPLLGILIKHILYCLIGSHRSIFCLFFLVFFSQRFSWMTFIAMSTSPLIFFPVMPTLLSPSSEIFILNIMLFRSRRFIWFL